MRTAAEPDWYSRFGGTSQGAHVLYFILFPIINIAAIPVFSNARSVYVWPYIFGIFLAEIELLAIWFTFNPKSVWMRWLTSVSVGALLYFTLLLGITTQGMPLRVFGSAARVFLLFPLIFLIMQLPGLFARFVLGWRGAQERNWPAKGTGSQFQIHHMMIATGVVAGSLALARLAVVDNSIGPDTEIWSILGIGCFFTFVASAVSLLPMLWGILGARNGWVGGIVATGFVFGAAMVIAGILIALFGRTAGGVVGFIALAAGTTMMMGLELGIARACGYRITRKRAD